MGTIVNAHLKTITSFTLEDMEHLEDNIMI